jgi:hypothetical protein
MDRLIVHSSAEMYEDWKDLGRGITGDEKAERDKEKERRECRRKSVYQDCSKLVACGEIDLGDQRWIHRQHGVCQEEVGEAPMVCPYSQRARDLEFSRLLHTQTLESSW